MKGRDGKFIRNGQDLVVFVLMFAFGLLIYGGAKILGWVLYGA